MLGFAVPGHSSETRHFSRDDLSRWYQSAYGSSGAICSGPMFTDIGCLQSHTALGQLTSARCELASTLCKLTSSVCQFTSTRIQLQRAGGVGIGQMSTDIGPLYAAARMFASGFSPVLRDARTQRRSVGEGIQLSQPANPH